MSPLTPLTAGSAARASVQGGLFRVSPLNRARAIRSLLAALALGLAAGSVPAAEGPSGQAPAEKFGRFLVTAEPYQRLPVETVPMIFRWSTPSLRPRAGLQPSFLEPYVVTASRSFQRPQTVAATAQVYNEAALQRSPALTLDATLRSTPSFSLFRRTDSLTAHPTTQGVSLRGLGPSGASRSIVLLDGVPLNDPFGGWVNWSKVPRLAIARVELVSGGGAQAWGNAALSGAVQVFTVSPKLALVMVDTPPAPIQSGYRGTAGIEAMAGDFSTRSMGLRTTQPVGPTSVQLLAEDFATNGFRVVRESQRGAVDVPAWSRHRSLTARVQVPVSLIADALVTVRGFEEKRGNGTPYQRNGSREKFASVRFAGRNDDEDFAWNALAFVQDQSFASTFSSVAADRTSETPASDQFAVPASAAGASATMTRTGSNGALTTLGADLRGVHGETRENFAYSSGEFTRLRVAGGTQLTGGVFVFRDAPLSGSVRLNAGLRLDAWRDSEGRRRESVRGTGVVVREDRYAKRDGVEPTPSAGVVWIPSEALSFRANGQRAFRRPTLNELYRPFRQGSVVTEANAALKTEHATSLEAGGTYTFRSHPTPERVSAGLTPRQQPKPATRKIIGTIAVTAFWNELTDAVTNVTVARGPGSFPVFGTLGAGVTGRQRLNLERIRVQGLEAAATWNPAATVTFSAAYLLSDSRVMHSTAAPSLTGKRLAEVPVNSASVGATWAAPGSLRLTSRLRWIDRQFDDDENELRLGAAVIVDVGVSRAVTKYLELFLNVQNAGNARIETARTAAGLISTGTPRFAFGGIRGSW